VLGENFWRLEWYDSGGKLRQTEAAGTGAVCNIGILAEWPSAVLAWPYWPEKGLAPGLFYPAGAIFPFDIAEGSGVSGDTIVLSWEAGAEAYFYRELDKVRDHTAANRAPEFFDWKRFRTFLREEAPDEIRLDPWLADWKAIAERTVNAGFRSSYLRAETRIETDIIIPHDGPWLGASPFRPVEFWEKNQIVSLPLSSRPEIFVCSGGMISTSIHAWLWTSFP
jgi:hypothetical protein